MTDKRLELYNKILQKYWGYPSLKSEQYTIISNVLDGKDICAILATGFGKSICYQLPTMISKKCVIVLSPLIALMHEQGEEMKNRNIPVCVFNSTTNTKEKEQLKLGLNKGEYRLIYMTPEYFIKSETFVKKLVEIDNLAMVCIDEAHAVSTWGLDFRPSYTKLNVIREWIPDIPILTLTATASTKVKDDIINILGLQHPFEVIGNFDRPNLKIFVNPRLDNIIYNIGSLLDKYTNEYIIIYCKTRDETDKLAEIINKYGVKCESYHAGICDKKRNEIQQNFIDGVFKCIIATIAFGMGINIPTVRLVIHYNCPKNIESYYQEIGRAGRDGKPSECYLFYSKKDFVINRLFLKTIIDDVHRNYQENQIRLIEKYVYSSECRRKLLLVNFGQKIESCTNCDNCLRRVEVFKNDIKEDLTDYTKEVYIILNLLNKINDKFGSGMLVNILLGKESKVKIYMQNYEEYGVGLSFGCENWWKDFIRLLINNDYLIETQVKGSFGSTLSLTNKGKNLRKELILKFSNYSDLLQYINDIDKKEYDNTSNSEDYIKYKVMLETLKVEKKIKTTKTKTAKIKSTIVNTEDLKVIVPKTVRSVKTIKNTNSYDDIMPSTFIKSKLSKTTEFDLDDLEKDLAELNKSSETN
jgi:Werner syndrome ATP-dependent helicase